MNNYLAVRGLATSADASGVPLSFMGRQQHWFKPQVLTGDLTVFNVDLFAEQQATDRSIGDLFRYVSGTFEDYEFSADEVSWLLLRNLRKGNKRLTVHENLRVILKFSAKLPTSVILTDYICAVRMPDDTYCGLYFDQLCPTITEEAVQKLTEYPTPKNYVSHLDKLKEATSIPIRRVANTSWVDYYRQYLNINAFIDSDVELLLQMLRFNYNGMCKFNQQTGRFF